MDKYNFDQSYNTLNFNEVKTLVYDFISLVREMEGEEEV